MTAPTSLALSLLNAVPMARCTHLAALAIVSTLAVSGIVGCAPAPEEDVDDSSGAFTGGGVLVSALKNGRYGRLGCSGGPGYAVVTSDVALVQHARIRWPDGAEEEADLDVSTDDRNVVTSVPSSNKAACGFKITVTGSSADDLGFGTTWQRIRIDPKCTTKQSTTLVQIQSGSVTRTGPACG